MYAVVFFPQNLPREIQNFRKKYDFKWNLIPPHITLVFPFNSSDETAILGHIKKKIVAIKPFDIAVDTYKKSHDNYLYLTFKKGVSELTHIHDILYTAILEQNLKTDITYEPHLTIGNFQNENGELRQDVCSKALTDLDNSSLSYEGEVDAITLIEIIDDATPRRLVQTIKLHN